MYKKLPALILLVSMHLMVCSQRIAGSPYPISIQPDTLFTVDMSALTPAQQLSVVTLQGLLAKVKPQIIVERGNPAFRRDLQNNYNVVLDTSLRKNFAGLLQKFSSKISGYVLYLDNDSSIHAAISLCSNLNAIAIDTLNRALADSLGMVQVYNVIGKGQSWAFDSLKNSYSTSIVVYQEQTKNTFLSDYSVFTGAYHFHELVPLAPLSNSAFDRMQTNGAVFGWGDEFLTCYAVSEKGLHLHAADWASNLSVFTNFSAPTMQHTHTGDTILKPGVHTVCFVMSDGDNIQWLLNDFAQSHRWFGSPNRGLANIGWTISPALTELAPTVMKSFYDSATTADHFIAGPSGMGYVFPNVFQPHDSAVDITSRMMQKANLSILNTIGNGYNSTNMGKYLQSPNIDAVFYYPWENYYEAMHGYSECINNKPVITPRYTLVPDNHSVSELAQLLSALPKDPTSPDGYSLVCVHVWTMNVDSVLACISLLDSTIRVVAPDAFVKLFKQTTLCSSATSDIGTPISDKKVLLTLSPNPASGSVTISTDASVMGGIVTISDLTGRVVQHLIIDNSRLIVNTGSLSDGIYFITLTTAAGVSDTKKLEIKN